jgi:hypothetical protein
MNSPIRNVYFTANDTSWRMAWENHRNTVILTATAHIKIT